MQRRSESWRYAARRLQVLAGCVPEVTSRTRGQVMMLLDEIERHHGVTLPPSYREFMLVHDGWPRMFRDASLLSCEQLLDVACAQIPLSLDEHGTPIPGFVGPARPNWRQDKLLAIGMNPAASILIALDASSVDNDGEMEVIVWIAGLGVRLRALAEAFLWLGDLCGTEDAVQCDSAFAA